MKTYDLEKLWDEHTKYEFATPDVEATLATMVEDAYVNHVPVMTGGKGKSAAASKAENKKPAAKKAPAKKKSAGQEPAKENA